MRQTALTSASLVRIQVTYDHGVRFARGPPSAVQLSRGYGSDTADPSGQAANCAGSIRVNTRGTGLLRFEAKCRERAVNVGNTILSPGVPTFQQCDKARGACFLLVMTWVLPRVP